MKVRYLTRKLIDYNRLPNYHDGTCTLHEVHFTTDTFQKKYIKSGTHIYYREKAIYNKTKIEYKQIGIEVIYMLVIPFQELKRDAMYAVVIDDEIFEAQNITTVTNSNGFKEIEITLSKSNIYLEEQLWQNKN